MKVLANWVSRAAFFTFGVASTGVAFWLIMPSSPDHHLHPHDAVPGRASGPSLEESLRRLAEKNVVKVEDQIDVEPPRENTDDQTEDDRR